MELQVKPGRCIKASDDLRQTESRLRKEAAGIEEIMQDLRRSDDESMQVAAAKISRIHENLDRRTWLLHKMSIALERAATIYTGTENSIADHGDANADYPKSTYQVFELKVDRKNIEKTFNKL